MNSDVTVAFRREERDPQHHHEPADHPAPVVCGNDVAEPTVVSVTRASPQRVAIGVEVVRVREPRERTGAHSEGSGRDDHNGERRAAPHPSG